MPASASFKNSRLTIINLAIRIVTLGGRFLLLFILARQLSPDELGSFGIFTTSVSLALYVVGLDFYTYSSRKILIYPVEERSPYLRDQLIFFLLSYLVIFPLLASLFLFHVLETRLIIFFYIILILEHLAQEAHRTFVVFSKPLQANIILFIRTGSWAFILFFLWITGINNLSNLNSIFLFWVAGCIASLLLTVFYLSKFKFIPVKNIPVNWKWIAEGIKVSLLFFAGTAGYKIIDIADRYFIQYYRTNAEAGIYIFYANICNIIETLAYTAVVIIFSPRLIESFYKNPAQYRRVHLQFSKQLLIYTLVCGMAVIIVCVPALHFLNKPDMVKYLNVFIILAAAKMILNISLIFHYILYVRKIDNTIIFSALAAAAINIVLNFVLIPAYGMMGAALATLISLFVLLAVKLYFSRKYPEVKNLNKLFKKINRPYIM